MTETTEKSPGTKKHFLVLTAAGSSSRMGGEKKECMRLGAEGGKTVISSALLPFLRTELFSAVLVTAPEGRKQEVRDAVLSDGEVASLLAKQGTDIRFTAGGSTRQESVHRALEALSALGWDQGTLVAVHDGARPFVTKELVLRVMDGTAESGAASPAVPPVDTCKVEDGTSHTIARHLDRSSLCAVQTPQAFRFGPLLECHRKAKETGLCATDDTQVWDAFPECTEGKPVRLVQGERSNTKITYPADMPHEGHGTTLRTGLGIDVHRLAGGRPLMLGGIRIPSEKGEVAHSDGDVLLHAVTDALLGASALGDIGSYFPPEDDTWKGADSARLLSIAWSDIRNEGWELSNLDCVVELEKPKFLPHRQAVRESIARILGCGTDRVFVKAKTAEGLESIGEGNAVRASCVCILCR